MKILAVVIIYNPQLNILERNMNAWYSYVSGVLIWDNSDARCRQRHIDFLANRYKDITYKGDGTNHGISYCLNKSWLYAEANGFDTILTMDQDSIFSNFPEFAKDVQLHWEQKGYCPCGPNVNEEHAKGPEIFTESHYIITSGMMIPVELLKLCGGYCADFSIDGIDVELCYHLHEKGYSSMIDTRVALRQQYGEPKKKQFGRFSLYSKGYQPYRLYGIFRNHIIVWRKYHHPRKILWTIFRLYFLAFVLEGVVLLEDNKIMKLKAVTKGIIDGFKFNINK